MEAVEGSEKVVGQDKGSGAPRPAGRAFRLTLHDFFTGRGGPQGGVTPRRRWGVTPRMQNPFSAALGVLTLMAGLIASAWMFQLRIMLTDSSAPAGIYQLVAAAPERGDLVLACLPAAIARQGLRRGYLQKGDCGSGAEPVAKVIGALPGDTVELEPDRVAVNGSPFANSRTAAVDSHGRPLGHVPSGAYRAAAGEVWLFGFNNRRSWDARYFGPVPLANVRGVLRPVVTW
jgi:conjugative transfer signal peptidase TraF